MRVRTRLHRCLALRLVHEVVRRQSASVPDMNRERDELIDGVDFSCITDWTTVVKQIVQSQMSTAHQGLRNQETGTTSGNSHRELALPDK